MKFCDNCQWETNEQCFRVGNDDLCGTCMERLVYGTLGVDGKGNFDGAIDEIAMWCGWLFDKSEAMEIAA